MNTTQNVKDMMEHECGLFADRKNMAEAVAYAHRVARACENPPAVLAAVHVVLNTAVGIVKEAMNAGGGWTCPDCGRKYEDMTGGPCPSDDCPSHDKTTDDRPRATPDQINEARRLYAQGSDDNIEIDDDALVSEGEGGAFVQAWVWVPAGGADEHYQDTATTDDLERSYGPHQAALMRGAQA